MSPAAVNNSRDRRVPGLEKKVSDTDSVRGVYFPVGLAIPEFSVRDSELLGIALVCLALRVTVTGLVPVTPCCPLHPCVPRANVCVASVGLAFGNDEEVSHDYIVCERYVRNQSHCLAPHVIKTRRTHMPGLMRYVSVTQVGDALRKPLQDLLQASPTGSRHKVLCLSVTATHGHARDDFLAVTHFPCGNHQASNAELQHLFHFHPLPSYDFIILRRNLRNQVRG